jgi:hypothetical protein
MAIIIKRENNIKIGFDICIIAASPEGTSTGLRPAIKVEIPTGKLLTTENRLTLLPSSRNEA